MKKPFFWWCLAGGLFLRLLAWWLLPSVLADDAAYYQQIGINLLREGRYFGSEGLAFRPPLQPFFIFLIYYFGGISVWLVSLIQIGLSLLTAVLIGQLASLLFNQKVGGLALILAALSFDLSLFAPLLMSESLVIFLIVFGFWALVKERHFLSGSAWGLGVLGKPLLLPVFLVVSFGTKKRKVFENRKIGFIFCLLLILPALGWSVRNWLVFQKPVFISTNGGLNFYIGNNPYSRGSYDQNTKKALSLFPARSETKENELYFQEGIKFVKRKPLKAISNLVRKPFYLLATFGGSAEGLIIRKVERGSFGATNIMRLFFGAGQLFTYWLVLLGAIYFWLTSKKFKQEVRLVLVFVFGYFISLLPFFTFPRFRLPLLPFLIILAGAGIVNFFKKPNPNKLKLALFVFVLLTIRDGLKLVKFVFRLVGII